MATTREQRRSLWQATAEAATYPQLDGNLTTEVLVIGGGVTGLTTAVLLLEAGADVTVVEAVAVGHGTTGRTTGKVTSQHGLIYQELVDAHGDHVARTYGRVNQEAIDQVRGLVDRHGIDADLEDADAFVYTEQAGQVGRLRREAEVAAGLGLPAEWTDTTDLPFEVAGAVCFSGQAQLHAVRYVAGLAAVVAAHPRGQVIEGTRAHAVRERDDAVTVDTDGGRVSADHVVVATLLPIVDRGFEFARTVASRTYGIAARAAGDATVPAGMYISAEQPSRSIRRHREGDATYVIVVGDAHETGHDTDTGRHDAALADFARDRLGATDVRHRWSAQDFTSVDLLPFIGSPPFARRIHVATGFNKWGLTSGTAAAGIITDQINGRGPAHAAIFSPTRRTITASARGFLRHNLDVAKRFVADRALPDATSIDDIPAGGGGVVRRDGELLAVSKDAEGVATVRSAICRHLGCVVQWNRAERSWDCPCHGSRYGADGGVLDGPATRPLA